MYAYANNILHVLCFCYLYGCSFERIVYSCFTRNRKFLRSHFLTHHIRVYGKLFRKNWMVIHMQQYWYFVYESADWFKLSLIYKFVFLFYADTTLFIYFAAHLSTGALALILANSHIIITYLLHRGYIFSLDNSTTKIFRKP